MTPRNKSLPFLSGYIPAVPTPFGEDGHVDFVTFKKFCEHLIREGAHALLVCSAAGEAPTLSPEEHETVIRAAVSAASGCAAVIAAAGSNSTASAIELSERAQQCGASAVLSVVPYYSRPTQAGLHVHFHNIAKAIDLPLLIHDAPAQTGCKLANETVLRLSENPKIVGLVDGTGELPRFIQLRSMVKKEFVLLSGDDLTAPAFLSIGGDGCISVVANIDRKLCHDIEEAVRTGNLAEINALATRSQQLASWLVTDSNPARLKYALALLGFMAPMVRAPLVEPDNLGKTEIIDGMRKLGGLLKQRKAFWPLTRSEFVRRA